MGKLPRVREWIGPRVIQNISESDYAIREKAFELTVGVDRDDIETDNLGIYSTLFEAIGEATIMDPEQMIWDLLKNGFATNCYDGQFFFDTDHPVLDADGVTVLSVANTDGGAGTPWFLLDTTRVVKPLIKQVRRDFGEIVAKDKVTDDNVFDMNEYRYGVDARMNFGYGFWQMAWGSKQALDAAHYEPRARRCRASRATTAGRSASARTCWSCRPRSKALNAERSRRRQQTSGRARQSSKSCRISPEKRGTKMNRALILVCCLSLAAVAAIEAVPLLGFAFTIGACALALLPPEAFRWTPPTPRSIFERRMGP
jgi:phage major head subunit gpT-like protein